MPIQVPRLNRTPIQTEESVGRIQGGALEVVKPLQTTAASAERLVGEVADYYVEQEKAEGDATAMSVGVEYQQDLDARLNGENGAKYQEGDPTPVYDKYDADSKIKRQSLEERYAGASDYTKAAIRKELDKIDVRFYDNVNTARGHQDAVYTSKVADGGVKFEQESLANEGVAHVKVDDESSLISFQNSLNNIKDIRLKEGIKNGTVRTVYDPNGEIDPVTGQTKILGYDINPSMKVRIAEDVSHGVSNAIETLSRSGDIEGAKFLMKKFGSYIAADKKPKLNDTIEKESVDQKGIAEFFKVRNLPPQQAMTKLNQEVKDPKVLSKAMAELESFQSRMEQAKDRQQKKNAEFIGRKVLERQSSDLPFLTKNDLENDPDFKRVKNNLNPKDLEALYSKIEQPKESSLDAKNKYFDNLFNGKYQGMDPVEFHRSLVGLDKEDMKKAEKAFIDANSQTPSNKHAMIQYAGTELTRQLQTAKSLGIAYNDFGKFDNDTKVAINEYREEFLNGLNSVDPLALKDPVKVNEYVKDFVSQKVRKEAYKPKKLGDKFAGNPSAPKLEPIKFDFNFGPQNTTVVPGVQQAPANTIKNRMSIQDAMRVLRKELGREPTLDETKQFMQRSAGM